MNRSSIIFIIIATLALSIFYLYGNYSTLPSTLEVVAPKGVIKIELADTPELRSRGLGLRDSLGADSGMLFVFDEPGDPGFWMKDMNFALDIVWINENKQVIEVTKNVKPETFPQSFHSEGRTKYVLELNSGGAESFGIESGVSLGF